MRVSWDEYFMQIAKDVATRATCDRRHVGAVLVRSKHILTTGYNGSMSGLSHCDDVGHYMVNGHCDRTAHAESNAISQAAKEGVSVDKSTLYVTTFPCFTCFKLCVNAGVCRVVYGVPYADHAVDAVNVAALQLQIELVELVTATLFHGSEMLKQSTVEAIADK